jgi:hypothetical protein
MPLFNIEFQFPLKLTNSSNYYREPTILETFSRTVRTYDPSSIHIPSTPRPTPPRVSRPVSFGKFMNPSSSTASCPRRRHCRRSHMRGGEETRLREDQVDMGGNEERFLGAMTRTTRWAMVEARGALSVTQYWKILRVQPSLWLRGIA